jgi:hypothetical protein
MYVYMYVKHRLPNCVENLEKCTTKLRLLRHWKQKINLHDFQKHSHRNVKILRRFHFSWLDSPPSGPRPPHCWGSEITLRHTTLGRTTLDDWSALRRNLLPDNTHHSQQTVIHTTGRIRTCNPSKRATADPCLRQRVHYNWHSC